MNATANKRQQAPNLERFKELKARINDLYANIGNKIRANDTVWCTALVFDEMRWIIAECKRLAGGGAKFSADEDRFKRIVGFVARVSREQQAAIKGGQIIKIGAEIFGAYRFLVRTLEEILKHIVDDEVVGELESDRMVDEHTDRICLDLAEGLGDPDDDDGDDGDGTDLDAVTRHSAAPPRQPEDPAPVVGLGLGRVNNDDDLPGGAG